MNFMERANNNNNNNNNKKRSDNDDDYSYGEEDRKTTTKTTTSSSISPQGGGMVDHPKLILFSTTTNWLNSSSSTTAALVPPPNNLYQQYNPRGGFIRDGTISPSTLQQQQQQQQEQALNLMDNNGFPLVVVREREHMFDKVVTPSDVGKLNRLVIPKQHAEKYFPLDSSTQDKGLLLNFEDVSTSKLWRFRYSYWNSSQSYVMTKGWSRFVKDKKLDPGDIVSFLRDRHKIHHLFIDCTHRPPPPPQYHHHLLPFPSNINNNINNNKNNNNLNFSLHPATAPRYAINNSSSFGHMGYWNGPPGGLLLPAHAATPFRGGERGDHYYHDPLLTSQNPNYRITNNYHGASGKSLNDYYYRHIHQQQRRQEEDEEEEEGSSSSSSGMMRRYLSLAGGRELEPNHGQQQQQQEDVLLHSIPILVQASPTAATTSVVNNKRLRLFGVNMDCPISDYDNNHDNVEEDITILPSTATIGNHNISRNNNNNAAVLMPPPSNSLPHLVQLRLNNNNNNNNDN